MSDETNEEVRPEDVPEGKLFPAEGEVPHDEHSVPLETRPPDAAPVGSLPVEEIDTEDDDGDDDEEDDDEVDDDNAVG